MGFDIIHADANTVTTVTTANKADVDALADHCAALRAGGHTKTKDGDWLAMRADTWVVNDWCTRKGVSFREFMRDRDLQNRFINDPDNAAFRVHEGRL
jgi:hypothetical protein